MPGGTYNRSDDPNAPATVGDFRLDTYEVTVGRFRKFVAAYLQAMTASGAGTNPNNAADMGWDASWNSTMPADQATLMSGMKCDPAYQTWTDSEGSNESRPINCITWYEAFAFCVWDGGRLLTEAEWNYAAVGGSEQRAYPWGSTAPGNDANLAVYGCYYNGTGSCTGVANIAPVGSAAAGNGKWGHADLAGNVWEWVLDWHKEPYPKPCNNCANLTPGDSRVSRGGHYGADPANLLPLTRNYHGSLARLKITGARCARMP